MDWGKPRHIVRNLNNEILDMLVVERIRAMVNRYHDDEITAKQINRRWLKERKAVRRSYKALGFNPDFHVPNRLIAETIKEELIK